MRRRFPRKPLRPRRTPTRGGGGVKGTASGGRGENFWWGVAIAVVAGLILVAISGLGDLIGSIGDAESKGGRLELVGKPVVTNDRREAARIEDSELRSLESAPQIDVAVRNEGSDPVQISEARVTVLDSTRITHCKIGGADIPKSRPYEINLVSHPTAAERVIEVDVREEVPPSRSYSLVLAFESETTPTERQLFAVRVDLVAEPPDQEIYVGRFLLGVPEPPMASGSILPVDEFSQERYVGYALAETWCYRYNFAEVKRLTELPGLRDDEIASLTAVPSVPGWSPSGSVPEARSAVGPLLRAQYYPPVLAVFAADQTGDAELAERTRERAAEKVFSLAEQDLDRDEASIVNGNEVREALEWVPGARGEDLLRRILAELQSQA